MHFWNGSSIKKILALALGMLILPLSAFGMQEMDEARMASVTAQSGVAIAFENIQIYTDEPNREIWFITKPGYGLDDAAVGLVWGENNSSYTFINMIGSPLALIEEGDDSEGLGQPGPGNNLLRGNYQGLNDMGDDLLGLGVRTVPLVMTVRVAPHQEDIVFGSIENGLDGGAFIEIGLPTIEIYQLSTGEAIQAFVTSERVDDPADPRDGLFSDAHVYSMGTVWLDNSDATTAILGGRVGITSFGSLAPEMTSYGF